MKNIYLVILILFFTTTVYSFEGTIRCGYGAGIADEEAFRKMGQAGLNYYIWKMGVSPVTGGKLKWSDGKLSVEPNENVIAKIKKAAEMANKHGIKLLLSTGFNEYALKALRGLGKYEPAVVEGPRSYLSRGVNNAPWPGDEKLWNGIMLEDAVIAAKLAKENPGIGGFLFDLEMYAGKINWWYCTSFDSKSIEYFCKHYPEIKVPELKIGERYNWLSKNKLLDKYYNCLSTLPYQKAKSIAGAVKQVNPGFQLGMYAFGRDWFHPWFAKGLSEGAGQKVWIFSEDEYNNGLTPNVYATMRFIDKMNFQYRYIPGLHIIKHSPEGFEKEVKNLTKACDGYWLFTMATLLIAQEKLPKGYKTPEGTSPDNYWKALTEANSSVVKELPVVSNTVTPNIFQRKEDSETIIPKVKFSVKPENICGKPAESNMLFDGLDLLPGVIAWNLGNKAPFKKKFQTVITLPKKTSVDKIGLRVPVTLVRNFRVIKDFRVSISILREKGWHTAGKWTSKQLKNNKNFFNIIKTFSKPEETKKIVITLEVLSSDEQVIATLKKYDGIYIILSEVCIWGNK